MGYSWRVTSSSISQLTLPMALHDTLRQYGGSSPHAAATGNGPTCHHTIARPLQATRVCASVAVVVRRFCKVALRLCSSARSCVVFWCVASRHAGHPFSLILCAIVIATVTRTCLPACLPACLAFDDKWAIAGE